MKCCSIRLNNNRSKIEQQLSMNWIEKIKMKLTRKRNCKCEEFTTGQDIYIHYLQVMVANLSCTWVCGVVTPLCHNLDGGIILFVLEKRFFHERLVIEAHSISVSSECWTRLIYGGQGECAIFVYFLNLIWTEPPCLQFSWEIFESGFIEEGPISFLDYLLPDKVIIPFISLLLDDHYAL